MIGFQKFLCQIGLGRPWSFLFIQLCPNWAACSLVTYANLRKKKYKFRSFFTSISIFQRMHFNCLSRERTNFVTASTQDLFIISRHFIYEGKGKCRLASVLVKYDSVKMMTYLRCRQYILVNSYSWSLVFTFRHDQSTFLGTTYSL